MHLGEQEYWFLSKTLFHIDSNCLNGSVAIKYHIIKSKWSVTTIIPVFLQSHLLETLLCAVSFCNIILHAWGQHVVETDPHSCLDDPSIIAPQAGAVVQTQAWTVHCPCDEIKTLSSSEVCGLTNLTSWENLTMLLGGDFVWICELNKTMIFRKKQAFSSPKLKIVKWIAMRLCWLNHYKKAHYWLAENHLVLPWRLYWLFYALSKVTKYGRFGLKLFKCYIKTDITYGTSL